MNRVTIDEIADRMKGILKKEQMVELKKVLNQVLGESEEDNKDYIKQFVFAKKSEGRSDRTEKYYTQVLRKFEKQEKDVRYATTDDIRKYLYDYQIQNKCSAMTIDNMRRILSSFYNWLEDEDYILKSPMRRIGKIKIPVVVRTVYTEEELENMRTALMKNSRDIAILNLLISSGIRVGELNALNIDDINLQNQSAIVYGKGNKERYVYFDIKTKISLQKYLEKRTDNLCALFITEKVYRKNRSERRLSINQIEQIIRDCGRKCINIRAYPHKFRRTMATRAIDKGMPIEQVQVLLGHSKIDTTLRYAQVQQRNVKYSYLKFIA